MSRDTRKPLSKADRALIRKGMLRHAKYISQDLRRMERIQVDAAWLGKRDSNCGSASSLTDAIQFLIQEALRLHREELKECKTRARRRKGGS